MIAAFLKKSFPTDLIKPLEVFLTDTYGKEKTKEVGGHLAEIQKLRDDCRVNEQTVSPATAIPKHVKYYNTLLVLEKRMSFGKSGRGIFTKSKNVEILFKWSDSFRPTKIEQTLDIKLEKYAILFNLGALKSLHAVKLTEQGEDGLKEACKLFRESAGVFQFLASEEASGFPYNLDIQKDACKFLANLMLAQAQAAFFEMAQRKKTSPGLLAKLALGSAKFFDQTDSSISLSPALQQWLEKANYRFSDHCKFQSKLFKAGANFYESQRVAASKELNTYGQEIARLQQANNILNSMGKYARSVVPTLEEQRKGLLNKKVQPRLRECVKDNNDIYHEPVPKLGDLTPIDMKQNIKPVPFSIKNDAADPFKQLVPKQVATQAETIRSNLMADAKRVADKANENTDSARAILASLGLPAAIDSIGAEKGLPDPVWARIEEVQKIGGNDELESLYARIVAANTDSWQMLNDEIIAKLDGESRADEEIRSKLGQQWSRTRSEELQAEYRAGVDTIGSHLGTAVETNSKLEAQMKENLDKFVNLARGRNELASDLPEVNEQKASEETEKLKGLLDVLSELIGQRDELKDAYANEAKEMDVTGVLMSDSAKNVDNVEALVKKPLQETEQKLEETYTKQEQILQDVNAANDEFLKSKDSNPQQLQREQIIHALNQACEKFKECHRHLGEGLKFYTDLMSDYITPLKQEVENYVAAREQERDILLGDLGTNIVKLGVAFGANGGGGGGKNGMEVDEVKNNGGGAGGGASAPNAPPEDEPNAYGYNPNAGPGPGPGPGPYAPQGGQAPPQGYYGQAPPQGYYGQPPPQGYYGQAPPQGYYPPPQGYYPPPQGYYQQPPAQNNPYYGGNPYYNPQQAPPQSGQGGAQQNASDKK